ncbi:MAG TPA: hypothetical protein VFF04_01190 [Candidatus Babeliales bacterium]|nr:hypothetical protein [Candidatus Babeliales bacterium]
MLRISLKSSILAFSILIGGSTCLKGMEHLTLFNALQAYIYGSTINRECWDPKNGRVLTRQDVQGILEHARRIKTAAAAVQAKKAVVVRDSSQRRRVQSAKLTGPQASKDSHIMLDDYRINFNKEGEPTGTVAPTHDGQLMHFAPGVQPEWTFLWKKVPFTVARLTAFLYVLRKMHRAGDDLLKNGLEQAGLANSYTGSAARAVGTIGLMFTVPTAMNWLYNKIANSAFGKTVEYQVNQLVSSRPQSPAAIEQPKPVVATINPSASVAANAVVRKTAKPAKNKTVARRKKIKR